ncbi:MAG: amylo-alpha-1,6-glucosidase, partial [Ktedonobacteraceae bacterium]
FFDDQALLAELWPNVEAILQWMLEWSDLDHDGLVEYARRNPQGIGLANQVWKDSGEAIQAADHHPIVHPVAWVEVQGYAWAAYDAYVQLAQKRQCLSGSMRQEIQQRMDRLQKGLLRFWLANEQYPAMALDGHKNPFQIVSSNPGHLLWSKCLNDIQAEQIRIRLMQPDILTPWGLRTLSTSAYYYNPLMYHCGAIWPFDNAVATIGLANYGFTAEARQIAESVLQAIAAFNNPVELYTVQPSHWIRSHRLEEEWFLADYFYACSVQTWTVAAILYFITTLIV